MLTLFNSHFSVVSLLQIQLHFDSVLLVVAFESL